MKYLPKSHPDKLLIDHKKGILNIAEVTDLILLAVSFHDVGKMNDNFQKKIVGEKYEGYSNHSYISAYYLINGFVNNEETIMKRFPFITKDNFKLIILILVNVIVGHHGYLRDIDEIFGNKEEWNKEWNKEWNNMIEYLKTIKMTEHVNLFFEEHQDLLGCKLNFIDDLDKCEYYRSYGRILDRTKWKDNALNQYFDTIITFAELVSGDRRDASGNKMLYRDKTKNRYAYSLENNLEWVFNNLRSNSELNIVRNKIRKMAVSKLSYYLKDSKNRVYTLTAPTGSGKTFMMLQLAVEILKERNYDYDIIYSLPYLSIIDQTTKILNNNLRIETLNYTSASDTSMKLQSMMENDDESNDLIEYAFSENCFDHSFIITTFNQLFETLLNNSTSKLMRLKNFKKRIFLIDEFQAASPTQYYTLINLLNEFCERYDCFAIISTATMPCFDIDFNSHNNKNLKKLFGKQFYPKELLPNDIFNYDVFNRYRINFIGEVNPDSLCHLVNASEKSSLLIVNTIRTSNIMYELFITQSSFEKVYLLNAHISPADRLQLLNEVFEDLKQGVKILVVSTQVIEAGVDISFPVVYRDAAPPSSVVQAYGRGNRNGEFGIVDVYLFLFKNPTDTQYDCNMVYQTTMTNKFKNDIQNKIPPITEKDFHNICKKYFWGLAKYVEQGKVNDNQNIVDDILDGKFNNIGKYKFIQGDPDAHTIYVGKNEKDWNEYLHAFKEMRMACGYKERDIAQIKFKRIRSTILQNSINIRTKVFETLQVEKNDILGVYKLLDENKYNSRRGLIEF